MNGNLTAEELQKKIQEDKDKEFREYAMEQIHNMHILEELGIPKEQSIEFLKLLTIREIADSLCCDDGIIVDNLNWINTWIRPISDCVTETRDGSFLRIIGDVTTYDY